MLLIEATKSAVLPATEQDEGGAVLDSPCTQIAIMRSDASAPSDEAGYEQLIPSESAFAECV